MARKIEFDRDQVLESAMNTFWQDGYSQTNILSLTKATQLQPGSLYAAFESKQGLLLDTLEHYSRYRLKQIQYYLDNANSPLAGVKSLLERIAQEVMQDHQQRGCFLVNTLLELSNNKIVQQHVNKYLDQVEEKITIALQSAHDDGELSTDKDPEALAKYLMVMIWGLRVFSKTNPDKAKIKLIFEPILSCLN